MQRFGVIKYNTNIRGSIRGGSCNMHRPPIFRSLISSSADITRELGLDRALNAPEFQLVRNQNPASRTARSERFNNNREPPTSFAYTNTVNLSRPDFPSSPTKIHENRVRVPTLSLSLSRTLPPTPLPLPLPPPPGKTQRGKLRALPSDKPWTILIVAARAVRLHNCRGVRSPT